MKGRYMYCRGFGMIWIMSIVSARWVTHNIEESEN